MKFDRIEYIKNEFPGSPDTLVVEPGGGVRYESHSNEATPDDPQIGTYRMSLPADRMASMEKLLESPPFQALPDHWGRLRAGEDARRIRVVAGSETSEKLVGYREPVDHGMQELIDALERMVVEAKSHPCRMLRISLGQAVVSPDRVLSAVLSLSSAGVEPVSCRNPLTMIGGSDGQISFQAWPDKPRSDLRPEDLVLLNPTSIEDPRSPGGSLQAPPFLDLAPGVSVLFNVQSPVGARSAGRHLIRVLYMNPAREITGHQVFAGELFSQTVAVDFP